MSLETHLVGERCGLRHYTAEQGDMRWWIVGDAHGAVQLASVGAGAWRMGASAQGREAMEMLSRAHAGWDYGVHFPANDPRGDLHHGCDLLPDGRCAFSVSGLLGWKGHEAVEHIASEQGIDFEDAVWRWLREMHRGTFREGEQQ